MFSPVRTSTVECSCPKVNTTNGKQLKRVAFYDFLSVKVKGRSTVLPTYPDALFFPPPKEEEGEKDPKGRGAGSQ